MDQQQLTILNLGQSLDDLANLDPRGYGVCKILYSAARQYTGMPLCMNAAQKLCSTLKQGDYVFIMTGFVLRPFKHAETDGIISSMLLCRALVMGFSVKPIVICPQENLKAVKNLAACVGLHLFKELDALEDMPISMGVYCFSKDSSEAEAQAKELCEKYMPSAAIAIECPGANDKGVYHNATGLDVTEYEAKQDVLFNMLKENGVLNIAIGDLGNEIGMGTIRAQLEKYVPYARQGACRCDCKGGLIAATAADNIITATCSDWGCYSLIAAIAFLMQDKSLMHDAQLEKSVMRVASQSGMIDMHGWLIPAIDGFGLEINMPIVSLMRELVKSALGLKKTCETWFEKVLELGYFSEQEASGNE